MRILLITQILPYPPNAGPRVKTWHVLRYLARQGHEVTLVTYLRPEEAPYVDVVRQLCPAVHVVPIRRSRLKDMYYLLKSNLTGRPFLIERDDLPPMRRLVRRLLATESFDVVHADQMPMAQFALEAARMPEEKRPYTIFDAHNATWTITGRLLERAPRFLQPLLRLETGRVKKYEGMLLTRFDHTMVVIPEDKSALMAGLPGSVDRAEIAGRISVIPITIDTDTLKPVQRRPGSLNILALGSMHYPPNVDGIRWFARDIFPLIQAEEPEVTLTIVGKSPPADLLHLAEQQPDSVEVTGFVPELQPYMERAALMVVPVRAGSGMRVRLLEAFARALPVVTTTVGREGIEAENGRHLLLADDPAAFARETIRLLRDPALQQTLAENGRRLALEKYDWRSALGKMDAVFAGARRPRPLSW